MKTVATLAFAGLAALSFVGGAEAMPVAPAGTAAAPVVDVAVVITKTVRRGPFGGRRVVRRVVRSGPLGRTVTTTRVVR